MNTTHQNEILESLDAAAKSIAVSRDYKITSAYLAAHARAMTALQAVENFIHDLPAPEGEVEIDYGHVGDMNHIAEQLEQIVKP